MTNSHDVLHKIVTQKEKDRTVTGDVTVTQAEDVTVIPSGDMARKAKYDRNILPVPLCLDATIAPDNWVIPWTYTVPDNRIAELCTTCFYVSTKIAVDGNWCRIRVDINNKAVSQMMFDKMTGHGTVVNSVLGIFCSEGTVIRGQYKNSDTVNHWITVSAYVIEFDA